jgi:import receptor subunit TOM22
MVPEAPKTRHSLASESYELENLLTPSSILDSEISTDSALEIENETLYERLTALKDIIPPQSRRRITSTVSTLTSFTKSGLLFSGKALWVLSTSAFLLGVPWALAYAEEEQYVQMEREQGMMRGANEVRCPL